MAIKSLYDLYTQKSGDFLEKLLNNHVVIDDDIPSSFFAAKRGENGGWDFFKKNEPITNIDRTISKFYEPAIALFNNIPEDKIKNIPSNLIFVTKYIVGGASSNSGIYTNPISADVLKLTHIIDDNNKQVINDKKTVEYWSKYLNIGMPPIIFDGYLDEDQKSAILDFVYTNQEDLSKRFRSESFTEYILSILKTDYESAGINSIVFRFDDNDTQEEILAKVIDPLFYDMQKQNPKLDKYKSNDIVYIILFQLMNFIEAYPVKDLMSVIDKNRTYDYNYIKIMNKIFIDYINQNYSDIMDLEFEVPDHIMGAENDLNLAFVEDQKVIDLINMNVNFKEVYRILLNFFKKKRKRTNDLFNDNMLKLFNALVEKIQKIISGKTLYEQYTPSFDEYNGLISEDFSFNYMKQDGGIENQFAMHQRRSPINVLVDYFQPLNNAHISAAETLYNKNKLKTLFVIVNNKQISQIKPFSTDTSERLIKKFIAGNHEFIEGYVIIEKNNIDTILKGICENYIPVLWAANKSKIDEYTIQMDYARKHNTKFNVSKRFKLIIAPELNQNRIIDYISTNNYQMYTSAVPKELDSEFYELQKELSKVYQSNS